ncbi:LuxR C-terminal-related transcriptional regulator [Paenibacillus oleatilyticus]|uniref:LuxR C-terminal-related transcriptional regulator n=1 Tax=Paenibacillus oleatilyticus TaxID=2594886 RepID=UPI001C1FE2DD|nr:LuxR C-terminal-related transcriptional regulator [Paenibacillus oleatilyticus]MBU7318156.1 LuxR C-terminal-related transcriptional regulator [Paenibacillus oleatilyticus]
MSIPIVSTKLYIPPPRAKAVSRPRLIERLDQGMHRKLTLISASAGCGKTTLVSEWLAGCLQPAAWLSLEEADRDPARFLTYLFAALQTIGIRSGEGVMGMLQAPGPLPMETILTAVLNKITAIPDRFILVLDDYHVIDSRLIDDAIGFLLERMPAQMHLVIITREDPDLSLARLRVRDQLTELRTADLRFTSSEAAEFLGQVMGLRLSQEDVAVLESRTEGWIAGLQLAALSMQGHPKDAASMIRSFTGSHHFVLDYLVEEVLQQQSASMQAFLLRTSILDRLCGPLCDAVLRGGTDELLSGQETLQYLERANLFIVPLDNERRWYRYHHLFADLLRQRLYQTTGGSSKGEAKRDVEELHLRASEWYEDHGLELEAFHHAAAAHDVERAVRLIEGEGMPLLFRGAIAPVLNWLDSMPKEELDARPVLSVMHASALLMAGQPADVERKLQAAEKGLQGAAQDDNKTRDLKGHIAAIRATLAVNTHQADAIIAESRRALEYLHPDNLPVRTATTWTLGYAYQLQGDRAAASQAYTEALSISRTIGHYMITMMATLGLGSIQEMDNRLYVAAETYRHALHLAGDPPLPVVCEAHLGLARIFYEWNDLETAMHHGQQAVRLTQQLQQTDRVVAGEVVLARLKLARGEVTEAAACLAKAEHIARRQNFVKQTPHIVAAQVLVLLHQGLVAAAAHLAQKHELPLSQARVHLAQGEASAALALLQPLREQAEAKGWEDERLKITVLQAVVLHAQGEKRKAVQALVEALTIAQSGGCIRTFVDEGIPMRRLLSEAVTLETIPDYAGKLLDEFEAERLNGESKPAPRQVRPDKSLIEPLSVRELEILQLVAQGLSNHEISERLFLALSTVKGYNRNIFDKLQVKRRTEAVARARELGLL